MVRHVNLTLTIRSRTSPSNAPHRNPAETCPSGQLATLFPRCYVGKDFFHTHPEGVARRFGSSERIFSGAI